MPNHTLAQPPEGFYYYPDFLSVGDECALIEQIMALEFSEVRMHGVTAKRRVAHFGWIYGYESWRLARGPDIPDFLLPLRERAAHLLDREPKNLSEVLVTEYPPGAGIGWHRDAPMFGPAVIGISVASACRFRFRRDYAGRFESRTLTLEPRSLYLLRGTARAQWQHSIPPAKALRYSITLRTCLTKAGGPLLKNRNNNESNSIRRERTLPARRGSCPHPLSQPNNIHRRAVRSLGD